MLTQIFGTLKCKDTQKAIRFFKERRIQTQFVDLRQKGLSPGELRNVCRHVPLEDLIDTEGREYEMLLEYPLLLRTPVVRSERGVTVGYYPETWKAWLK